MVSDDAVGLVIIMATHVTDVSYMSCFPTSHLFLKWPSYLK